MKSFNLLIILTLISFTLSAQSIERNVVSTGSGSAMITPSIQVDFTFGEFAISTLTTSGLVLTQGFQQPFTIVIITATETDFADVDVSIYPNPTSRNLHIVMRDFEDGTYTTNLFDMNGRLVRHYNLLAEKNQAFDEQIDISTLPTGTYFLQISKEQKMIYNQSVLKIK